MDFDFACQFAQKKAEEFGLVIGFSFKLCHLEPHSSIECLKKINNSTLMILKVIVYLLISNHTTNFHPFQEHSRIHFMKSNQVKAM